MELNTRINRIHERALRMVYDDYESSFLVLLNKDKSFTIHKRNIQTMAIEKCKVYKRLAPDIMKYVFPMKKNVLCCFKQVFQTRNVDTVHNGTETLSFLGPKIWSIIPDDFKLSKNLLEFKTKIRKWKLEKCPCRLCKMYIPGVGFIEI